MATRVRLQTRVFVCYRRADSGPYAGRLADYLAKDFRVFLDLDAIRAGEAYDRASRMAAGSYDVLLAVIGKGWLETSASGVRRIEDPDDLLRQEIAAALAQDIPVIPVLVGGASMPSESELPPPLNRLCKRNAFEMSDSRWALDVARLSREIRRTAGGFPIHWKRAALAIVTLIAALAAYFYLFRSPPAIAIQYSAIQLNSGDITVRLAAIRKLAEIADTSDRHYSEAIRLLTAHIRTESPWTEGHSISAVPADVQEALRVIASRRKTFENGETEQLDLHKVDITGARLRGAHFEGAILWGSNLDRVDLGMAHLRKADLGGVSLVGANLERADLTEAVLWESGWGNQTPARVATLREAVLFGAILDRTNLHHADLSGAIGLTEAQLRGCIINEYTKLPPYLLPALRP